MAMRPIRTIACGGLLSLLLGCTSDIGAPGTSPTTEPVSETSGPAPVNPEDPTGGEPTTPTEVQDDGMGAGEAITGSSCAEAGTDTSSNVLQRLSRIEYQLTLQDLFQLDTPPAVDAISSDNESGGFTLAADQTISPVLMRSYLEAATTLANDLLADSARRQAVIGCDTADAACLDSFIQSFGAKAFRRALTTDESTSLASKATTAALDTDDQFRFVIEALLTAPNFLYRVEIGDTPEGLSTLTARELAARLSFTVWGRSPSSELLAQADQGALDTPEGLSQVANQMLDDPRAQSFYDTYFEQWLGHSELRAPNEPASDWSDDLLTSMAEETRTFLRDFAWTPQTDFLGALTANFTYLDNELASYLGLPAPAGDGRVDFPPGHARENTGLLTHPSLISAKSDGDLVAIRGNWLRSTFLCEEVYIDPEALNQIGEELVGLDRYAIIEKRNTEAGCASCHSLIDPIGVGYAQFDASGRFDSSVDLSLYSIAPAFPDAAEPLFGSIGELSAKLAAMPEVAACMASTSFTYGYGRRPTGADSCILETATTRFIESQHSFRALLLGLVEAPAFRLRRSPEAL